MRTKLIAANVAQAFAWSYTSAGRELTQSDPATGTPMPRQNVTGFPYFTAHTLIAKMQTYDGYGQLSSLELPDHGAYSNIVHDTEGNVVSFNVGGDDITDPTTEIIIAAQYAYDIRNEQTTLDTMTAGQGVYQPFSSNSYLYGHDCAVPPVHAPAPDCSSYVQTSGTHRYNIGAQNVDPYSGAGETGGSVYVGYNNSNCPADTHIYEGRLAFDLDGRQSTESLQYYDCFQIKTSTQDTRAYDAENHVVSDSSAYDASSGPDGVQPGYSTPGATYTWNALGKARVVNDGNYDTGVASTGAPAAVCSVGPYTLHWDGDDLLFITNAAGALVQINVEKLGGQAYGCAASNPLSHFRVLDRDFSGTQVAYHSAVEDSAWVMLPSHSTSIGKTSVPNSSPSRA